MTVQRITGIILLAGICLLFVACAGFKNSTGEDHQALVKKSLDQLISAYESKNSRQFGELISNRYTGEKSVVIDAVQREFSSSTNVSLRYTFNNVTSDTTNKVAVAITYTRGWTNIKTAKTMNETKTTTLVFVEEDGVYKLYTQNRPFLFGLNESQSR